MADDNYNDEYQFADLDAPTVDSVEPNKAEENGTQAFGSKSFADNAHKTNVKRNALIAVLGLVILIVTYPFISEMFATKKVSSIATVPKITQPRNVAVVKTSPAFTTPAVVQPAVVATPRQDPNMNQKLASLEMRQQQVQTEIASTNNQLNNMNSTMSDMSAKIADLNRTLALFTAKMDAQSKEIEQLTLRTTPPKVAVQHKVKTPRLATPTLKYYIQAVIPGRAWLIASNGTTLDVREGNVIAGYGVVKLIDPQGRVITSSGQVIQFSQLDS